MRCLLPCLKAVPSHLLYFRVICLVRRRFGVEQEVRACEAARQKYFWRAGRSLPTGLSQAVVRLHQSGSVTEGEGAPPLPTRTLRSVSPSSSQLPAIPAGAMTGDGITPAKRMTPGTTPGIAVMMVGTMIMTVALMMGPGTVARVSSMGRSRRTREHRTGEHQHRYAQNKTDPTLGKQHRHLTRG